MHSSISAKSSAFTLQRTITEEWKDVYVSLPGAKDSPPDKDISGLALYTHELQSIGDPTGAAHSLASPAKADLASYDVCVVKDFTRVQKAFSTCLGIDHLDDDQSW